MIIARASLPVFSCTLTSSRLTVARCVEMRTHADEPHTMGTLDHLHSVACRGCEVGDAHRSGRQPTHWPDGSVLERGALTAASSPAPIAKPKRTPLAPFLSPVSSPAPKETSMPVAATHLYRGKPHTIAELLAHPDVGQGLNASALRMRITKGWDVAKALTTPLGAYASDEPSTPPPAPKTKKKPVSPIATSSPTTPTSAGATIDPIALLERLGIAHEIIGTTPRGRLVLLTEASS